MIGGQGVYCPVGEALTQCFHVVRFPKRRGNFGIGIIIPDRLVRQSEVMRGGLRGNFHPSPLRFTNQTHATRRADMRDMQARAGQLREQDVARDDAILGGARDAAQAEASGLESLRSSRRAP